ncbi:MAG: hypothetical protein JHC95_08760 [Solirubrobacteraceae bacterium]|nr:hypothetical protein [Solirubrobacteraceae bacterium]
MSAPADPRAGRVSPEVAADLPGITLWEVSTTAALKRRPDPGVRDRLRELASRVNGAVVIEARQNEIVHAYRVCFRHVGIEPDEQPTPYEGALLERLRSGGFPSTGVLADALLLALLDTKVGVVAFDDAVLAGGLRVTQEAGTVVLADEAQMVAPLFGPPIPAFAPSSATEAVRLAAVTPAGVPAIAAWEALDRVAQLLAP